jgi:glycosyltransferase involved in cell wall biosynthesis
MRLLYFLNFASAGGINRYSAEVLREMPSAVEVHVICPPGSSLDLPRATLHPDLADLQRKGGLMKRLRFLGSQFQNPVRLLRKAESLQPDIIHFGNVNHLTYSLWRRRLKALGIPFCVSVHDVRRQKAILSRSWEDRQLVAFYRDASALFVHGVAQREELAMFAGVDPAKIVIVPHGPYAYPVADRRLDIRKELGIPPQARVGLFFGEIRDDKGLDVLMEALAGQADTHLIVAGRSASQTHRPVSYYRDLARKLHIEAQIHFVESFIPDDKVCDYFRATDWCGLVYTKAFTSQSGVLCSAVHCRTPVLVACAPTLVEMVQKYQIGVVAADSSPGALAAAIQQLQRKQSEGRFGYAVFESECTWQRNADRTRRAYENILKLNC